MPCYCPQDAWESQEKNAEGKRRIVFGRPPQGWQLRPIQLPCGSCIGCQLERARHWAVRCMHETQLHEENCFVTLTYDDENLPRTNSLVPEHYVKFMKRLRKKYEPRSIRFFHCGEYGEQLERPHHHALLFGIRFDDLQLHSRNENGDPLWTSAQLQELWPYGFSTVGEASYESAGYIARYTLKKYRGKQLKDHYGDRIPEYLTMSRRPGIGKNWLLKYHKDVYTKQRIGGLHPPCPPKSGVVINGTLTKPPRYYDDLMQKMNKQLVENLKKGRKKQALKSKDNTPKRLMAREEVKRAQTRHLPRKVETQ